MGDNPFAETALGQARSYKRPNTSIVDYLERWIRWHPPAERTADSVTNAVDSSATNAAASPATDATVGPEGAATDATAHPEPLGIDDSVHVVPDTSQGGLWNAAYNAAY